MKTRPSKEKMLLKWFLLFRQLLRRAPFWRQMILFLLEKKKGGVGSFQENVTRYFKCPRWKGLKGKVIRGRLYTQGLCIKRHNAD